MTTHRAEQPVPDYVPGHDLLAGKVVVVTAAAGAGIGAAVVRRALEEGAKAVVFSDTHERRLGEAQEELEAEFGEALQRFGSLEVCGSPFRHPQRKECGSDRVRVSMRTGECKALLSESP